MSTGKWETHGAFLISYASYEIEYKCPYGIFNLFREWKKSNKSQPQTPQLLSTWKCLLITPLEWLFYLRNGRSFWHLAQFAYTLLLKTSIGIFVLWLNILLMLTFTVHIATANQRIISTSVSVTLESIQSLSALRLPSPVIQSSAVTNLIALHVSDGYCSFKRFNKFCSWKFGFYYINTVENKTLFGRNAKEAV